MLWWCPLAVTEVAFAGHVDGVGVAAWALAMATWQRGRSAGVMGGVSLAIGTKIFGAVMFPFVACRYGIKAALIVLGALASLYVPFFLQGSWVGLDALGIMSSEFEYNSTGYALLKGILPESSAQGAAMFLVLVIAGGLWWKWWRAGDTGTPPPVAAVLGVLFLWSPVFNPWYALWLLPGWAVRPSAWGIGVLLAMPIAFTPMVGVVSGERRRVMLTLGGPDRLKSSLLS